ncbi:MAG: hypothetical protein ACLQOO_13910 [Terriglobia bacterium]
MAKATLNRRSKAGRLRNSRSASKRVSIGGTGGKSPAGFSDRKSIAELAAEQGVRLEGQLERIMGAGAGLWASDKEFEGFVQGIYDRRREGLSLGKP